MLIPLLFREITACGERLCKMNSAFGAISGRREANSTSVEISPIPISAAWLAVRVMASAEPFDGSTVTSRPASRKYPRSRAW